MIQKTARMWLCRKKHKPRWVWPQKQSSVEAANQSPDVRLGSHGSDSFDPIVVLQVRYSSGLQGKRFLLESCHSKG